MDNKKYLTEENYQKAKKKITKASLLILIVGLVIGIGLIVTGIAIGTTSQSQKDADIAAQNEQTEKSLTTIEAKEEELNSQLEAKQAECDSFDTKSPTWFNDTVKCNREESALHTQLGELEAEKFRLKSLSHSTAPSQLPYHIALYPIGGAIIAFACLVAGVLYLTANMRKVAAFTTQQGMPVAKEGIEEMSPTFGKAAREITKGVKQGLKDEQ